MTDQPELDPASDQPTPENISRWRAAAAEGNVDAMCNLGLMCHANGQLVGSDSAETWWVQAAKKGHPDSMLNLGLLRYEQDLVVGENSAEHWWLLAAEAGSADAMCNVGLLRHATGQLVGDDSAQYWWKRAAADHEDAAHNLRLLEAELAEQS